MGFIIKAVLALAVVYWLMPAAKQPTIAVDPALRDSAAQLVEQASAGVAAAETAARATGISGTTLTSSDLAFPFGGKATAAVKPPPSPVMMPNFSAPLPKPRRAGQEKA